MEASASLYPVTLEVDYPERQSRWKTLFRLFLAIPVLLFAGLLIVATYAIAVATWLAILVKGRIPGWLFDFQIKLIDWETRAYAYTSLLTDAYPAFEDPYSVRVRAEYPERTSRWKIVIWKYVTSIPHSIVLWFLWIGVLLAIVVGWFSILFVGRFPKGLHGYVVGVGRWQIRVQAYILSLTDDFPPFSLSGNAGKAGNDTYVISSVIGVLLFLAMIGGTVLSAVYAPGAKRMDVSYAALLSGGGGTFTTGKTEITLMGAIDPANQSFPYLMPREGKRFVAFKLELTNNRSFGLKVRNSDFRLKDAEGKNRSPILSIAAGIPTTEVIARRGSWSVITIFEVNEEGQPKELRYHAPVTDTRPVIWEFR